MARQVLEPGAPRLPTSALIHIFGGIFFVIFVSEYLLDSCCFFVFFLNVLVEAR